MIPEKEGDSVGALSYWPDAAFSCAKGIEWTKKTFYDLGRNDTNLSLATNPRFIHWLLNNQEEDTAKTRVKQEIFVPGPELSSLSGPSSSAPEASAPVV